MTKHDPAPDTVYDVLIANLVADLRTRRAGATAPRTGERFPEFILPDANGVFRELSQLLRDGPIVLSFLRGQWCPYCQEELGAWKRALPALERAGGRLIFVAASTGGAAMAIRNSVSPKVEVLCDVDHGLSLSLGLAFYLGRQFLDQYEQDGLDLAVIYGTEAGLLPIPATFALDRQGRVLAAHIEPDFRIRAAPAEMIAAIAQPAGGH
jgi:peroxiredoxin